MPSAFLRLGCRIKGSDHRHAAHIRSRDRSDRKESGHGLLAYHSRRSRLMLLGLEQEMGQDKSQ
jgi:hypothetical protein